ncbi:hypothetical protein WMY93_014500 [Mugilogobius chulae]|uniref:ZP domain-containing protein n=1 Tax=Mugilogobius chulae TaxID=88201 RepID=A0AAW0NZ73_9GOBI
MEFVVWTGVRTECHERYFMIAIDLSFTGHNFYFEAVDGTGVFPITEQYAAQCGYTVTILPVPGLVELRASFFSCHTINQNDNVFTAKFNLVVKRNDLKEQYALNETCSPPVPWSPREVSCELNYLEVSVHSDVLCPLGLKRNTWDSTMELVYGSATPGWQVVFVSEGKEMKPMSLEEARSVGYTLNMTDSRLVLRAAYGQPHSFITMIDGVAVEVLHAILFSRQDWLVLLIDLVSACTMHEPVNRNKAYMTWETPMALYPGLLTTNFSFGLNGELWEPSVAEEMGYNLSLVNAGVKIGIPYNADGTYRRSVVDGGLFYLYTGHFYMEQIASNGGSQTRVRTYRKLSSPLIKSSLFTENRSGPDEQMFTVYLGNVPDDVELVSLQLEGQEFTPPFVNSSYYTLEIELQPNHTYAYTLKVGFGSPFVLRRFSPEKEAMENKLSIVFTIMVSPQSETYSYHTTVTVLTTVPPPKFHASCYESGITFKLDHQPSDFLWDITVGSNLLTPELASEQGYKLSNDSQTLQLDVPLFTYGYKYENISLDGFMGIFEVLVRDRKTFKVRTSAVKTCPFAAKEIVVCSKDGQMTVVADLSKTTEYGGAPLQSTLLDESCAPRAADKSRALFTFPLNSCNTRVKLVQDLLTYENEILYSLNATTPSTSNVLVQCRYPLAGLHLLFAKYKFQSELVGFGNIRHSLKSGGGGGIPFPTFPTQKISRPTFRPTVSRPVKQMGKRIGYKSPISFLKSSRRFQTMHRSGAPHNDLLRGELIKDHNLAEMILVQFLSELTAMTEENTEPRLEEQLGIRETVMRRQLPLTQRERKAGCRNFFWKTFTSC